MKRRSFLQAMGLVGGVAAVETTRATVPVFNAVVPREVVEAAEKTPEGVLFNFQLIEIVDGRNIVAKDMPTVQMELIGNVHAPKPNDEIVTRDFVKFEATRYMNVTGVRVFGGNIIGGRPWNANAYFPTALCLVNGITLSVDYTLKIGDEDPMSEEYRDVPLRKLELMWSKNR